MPIYLAAEHEWLSGTELVSEGPYEAVFEDNGETGYFYALDNSADDNPIRMPCTGFPSSIGKGWSQDGHAWSDEAIGLFA